MPSNISIDDVELSSTFTVEACGVNYEPQSYHHPGNQTIDDVSIMANTTYSCLEAALRKARFEGRSGDEVVPINITANFISDDIDQCDQLVWDKFFAVPDQTYEDININDRGAEL